MKSTDNLTGIQTVAMALLLGVLYFCSRQIVPGWEVINLPWPIGSYFGITAIAGAVAGFLGANGHRWGGMAAGTVAALGALTAVALHLHTTDQTSNRLIMLLAVIGALPGLGLFYLSKSVGQRRTPSSARSIGPQVILVSDAKHEVEPVEAIVLSRTAERWTLRLADEGDVEPGTVLSVRSANSMHPWVQVIVRRRERTGLQWEWEVEFVHQPDAEAML